MLHNNPVALAKNSHSPHQGRPILLSFKGARHDLPASHPAFPRNYLPAIHNDVDVIMSTYCTFRSKECLTLNERSFSTSSRPSYMDACANDSILAGSVDFVNLMLTSRFTVVLPGEGTHSYRLLEALGVRAALRSPRW